MDTMPVDRTTPVSCPVCDSTINVPVRIIDGGGTIRCPVCSNAFRRAKRGASKLGDEFNPRSIWSKV